MIVIHNSFWFHQKLLSMAVIELTATINLKLMTLHPTHCLYLVKQFMLMEAALYITYS